MRHQYHAGNVSQLNLEQARSYYLQVTKGGLKINEIKLNQGDGLTIKYESQLNLIPEIDTEFLLFDLA